MSEASGSVEAATWIRVVSTATGYSEEVLSAYLNMLNAVARIVVAYEDACEWERFIDALAPGMITPGGIDAAVLGIPETRQRHTRRTVMGEGHWVSLTFGDGGPWWDIHCGWDKRDRTRPCWPRNERGFAVGLGSAEAHDCGWRTWWENLVGYGMHEGPDLMFRLAAEWTDDGPTFTLTGEQP